MWLALLFACVIYSMQPSKPQGHAQTAQTKREFTRKLSKSHAFAAHTALLHILSARAFIATLVSWCWGSNLSLSIGWLYDVICSISKKRVWPRACDLGRDRKNLERCSIYRNTHTNQHNRVCRDFKLPKQISLDHWWTTWLTTTVVDSSQTMVG